MAMTEEEKIAIRQGYLDREAQKTGGTAVQIQAPKPTTVTPANPAGDGSWINPNDVKSGVTPSVTTPQPAQVQQPAATPAAATPTLTAQQQADQIKEQERLQQEGVVNADLAAGVDLGKRYGLEAGPSSIDEMVSQYKKEKEDKRTQMQKQIDFQNQMDAAEFAKFKEQSAGAVGANTAATAQGREGAMSGSAPNVAREFNTIMEKQIETNKIKMQAAQEQRNQLMLDLEAAQKRGDADMVKSISQALGAAQVRIDEARTNTLNSLSAFNAQTQKNLETFTGMVDSGATMTTKGISGLASTLNIPFDVANDYYESAQAIRDNKSLDLQTKQIQLGDLKYNFDEKVAGIRGEQAQAVNDFTKLAKSGAYTPDQLQSFATAMNIPNSMNPLYQNKLKLEQAKIVMDEASAKIEQYKAENLGKMPPEGTLEYLQYKKAELELKIAEAENADYTGAAPESTIKDVFYQPGKGDYGNGEGKRQCGEGYNDITDGKKVGDSYASKMAIVTKRSNPQVGNALVIPYGTAGVGHIETVINSNPIAGTIQTVSWNRDGRGTQTVETYKLSDLDKKYGTDWGFSDSKLKSKYLDKLSDVNTTPTTKSKNKFYDEAIANGMSPKKAKEWADTQLGKELAKGPLGKELPEEVSWAGTMIDNTYGDAEEGKAAARKKSQLADAIAAGDGNSAASIVKASVLDGVTAGERTALSDAMSIDSAYGKLQAELQAFKAAGLETGVVGNTVSEIYKGISKKRPEEAVKLQTRMSQAFNQYRKAITGAGASTKELEMLADSMPTFNKNINDIEVMTEMIKNDARSSLDSKIDFASKGMFRSYNDMQDKLDEISGKKAAVAKQKQDTYNFLTSFIGGKAEQSGQYALPEDLPTYDF